MKATTVKERYANHTSSFRHKKDSNKTELSKHIWKLNENNQDYTIKWSILKHAISYTGGSKRCNAYLEDKFCDLLSQTPNANTLELLDIFDIYNLTQHITEPTRVTSTPQSLLDLCITNTPDKIKVSA